jgi:pyrroloquinoline-quinone synthase
MDFWTSLDVVRERHDVLHHRFYQRWSAGELTRAELACYSGQYRHAVVALAEAAANAARAVDPAVDAKLRSELDAHAREEAEHVALWDRFCDAVGGTRTASPSPQTASCARAWAGDTGRPLLRSLAALYAIEAAQPAIASTKRAGLESHYGLPEGPATEYFAVHERRDVEHAAASRELIAERLDDASGDPTPSDDARAMLDEAEAVLRGNWRLLDGVERIAGGRPTLTRPRS